MNSTIQNKIHNLWLDTTREEADYIASITSKHLKVSYYDVYTMLTNFNCLPTLEEYRKNEESE
jgi:hypothetical protein